MNLFFRRIEIDLAAEKKKRNVKQGVLSRFSRDFV